MQEQEVKTSDYGIEEAVPQNARTYGFIDMAATWLGANCHPSSWWAGGVIAAAGFGGALLINLLAIPLSCVIVALVGFIGYKVGTTTIGLTRVSLGIRGSTLSGALNTMSSVGWCAMSHFLGAITISYILQALFQTPAYMEEGSTGIMIIGVLIIGVLSVLFVSVAGSKSIKVVEKILAVGLLLLSGYMSFVVIKSYDIAAILSWKPSADIALPFGLGFDTLLAFNLGWVVSSCEFTRYAKKAKDATAAPALGLMVAGWWFIAVGTLSVIAVATATGVFDPNMSDPSSVASSLGLGIVAFLVIIMATVTTNLISIYVAAYSLMNVAPKLSFKASSWITGIATIVVGLVPIFIGSFYDAFNVFLEYIGAAFPPLIMVILVDFYLIRSRKYDMSIIGDRKGAYWYQNGVNWYGVISWAVGAGLFLLFKKMGVGANSIGAIVPSMLSCGVLYYALAKIAIRKGAYRDLA